jgi:hypothetical protein
LPIESKGVAFRRFVEVPRRGRTRSSQTPGWRSRMVPLMSSRHCGHETLRDL